MAHGLAGAGYATAYLGKWHLGAAGTEAESFHKQHQQSGRMLPSGTRHFHRRHSPHARCCRAWPVPPHRHPFSSSTESAVGSSQLTSSVTGFHQLPARKLKVRPRRKGPVFETCALGATVVG